MAIRTMEELLASLVRRTQLLERRISRGTAPYRPPNAVQYSGTTAQRDAYYGVPATTAERADLANRQPVWFNIERGWEESYYVPTGTAGLTAKGLLAGASAGWYPTGPGPYCILQPTGSIAVAAGNYVQGWPGNVRRNGGAAWFTYDQGSIITQRYGLYDLRAWTIQSTGSAAANYHFVILNSGNVELTHRDGGYFPQNASLWTSPDMGMQSFFMNPGDKALLRLNSGTGVTVHMGSTTDPAPNTRGQMIARYVAPPLVSD